MDTTMNDAPRQPRANNQNRNNNRNNNNNNNQRNCTICGKSGHLTQDCRSKQNGNGNGNGNGNARNNNNANNANGTNKKVDPEKAKAHEQCYMHQNCRVPHTNADCSSAANKWSSKNPANQNNGNRQNNNNQQQQQQQQQQKQNSQSWFNLTYEERLRKIQQERNVQLKKDRLPIPGADCNYCKRCNTVGHLAALCGAPAIHQNRLITCFQCWNLGHTTTECCHPAFCDICRSMDHRTEHCDKKDQPNFDTFERRAAAAAERRAAAGPKVNTAPQPPAVPMAAPQPPKAQSTGPQFNNPKGFVFQPPTAPQDDQSGHPFFGRTPRFFINGQWIPLPLGVPKELHPIRQLFTDLAAQQETEIRRAVKAKCQTSHASYPLHLVNDAICQTERDLATVDPINPRIVLPAHIQPTSLLERLTASWLHTGAFARAAAMIRAGSNFFRDPRALDGIAKAEYPVCLSCTQPGMVLDATFCELVPGKVNVLTVEDHVEWGVSVAFACGCCKDQGFTWVAPGETLTCRSER